jgi:hypothetical protein
MAHGSHVITGEGSVGYMPQPIAADRIRSVLPWVRLIALLRNPVDRAYSHYHLEVRKGRESLSFEDAIDAEPERLRGEREKILRTRGEYNSVFWERCSYLARGIYVDQLERWLSVFSKERILLVRSEDLYREPSAVFRETLRFLGVRDDWQPGRFEQYNRLASPAMASETRGRLVAYFRPHNRRLRELTGRDFDWDK